MDKARRSRIAGLHGVVRRTAAGAGGRSGVRQRAKIDARCSRERTGPPPAGLSSAVARRSLPRCAGRRRAAHPGRAAGGAPAVLHRDTGAGKAAGLLPPPPACLIRPGGERL